MKDGRLYQLCFSRFMIRGWQATAIPYPQDKVRTTRILSAFICETIVG